MIRRWWLRRTLKPSKVTTIEPGNVLVLIYDYPLTEKHVATIRAQFAYAGLKVIVADNVTGFAVKR